MLYFTRYWPYKIHGIHFHPFTPGSVYCVAPEALKTRNLTVFLTSSFRGGTKCNSSQQTSTFKTDNCARDCDCDCDRDSSSCYCYYYYCFYLMAFFHMNVGSLVPLGSSSSTCFASAPLWIGGMQSLTGCMSFLPTKHQCQSTEGNIKH